MFLFPEGEISSMNAKGSNWIESGERSYVQVVGAMHDGMGLKFLPHEINQPVTVCAEDVVPRIEQ